MTLNRKKQIENNFGQNLHAYEDNAQVQDIVAQNLCDLVETENPLNILEIGCGTGLLTKKLISKFPKSKILATDISDLMVSHSQEKFKSCDNVSFQKMDGEDIILNQKFDLIVSNMTFQWFEYSYHSIDKMKSFLNQNGHLYFSTIGQNNFKEWQEALNALSLNNGLLKTPKYQDVVKEENHSVSYCNTKGFLQSLKKIGAHLPNKDYSKLSARELSKACKLCDEKYSSNISWHILYGSFQRL